MVVSLKANRKRILAFLILAAVVVGACIFLWSGRNGGEEAKDYPGGTNEERVAFLQSFGWQVDTEPSETREVMIPAQFNDVYVTYNVMQKAQGFDLKPFAGQICTQYKYKINNYPNETEVYATLLVQGNLIIGGDVACSEVGGFMHGFAPDSARYGEAQESVSSSAPESSAASSAAESGSETSAVTSAVESGSETSAVTSAVESGTESAPVESTAGEAVPEEAYPTD